MRGLYRSEQRLTAMELEHQKAVLQHAPLDFACPLHACARCGQMLVPNPDPIHFVRCFFCPMAYHTDCAPSRATVLADELINCGRHSDKNKH